MWCFANHQLDQRGRGSQRAWWLLLACGRLWFWYQNLGFGARGSSMLDAPTRGAITFFQTSMFQPHYVHWDLTRRVGTRRGLPGLYGKGSFLSGGSGPRARSDIAFDRGHITFPDAKKYRQITQYTLHRADRGPATNQFQHQRGDPTDIGDSRDGFVEPPKQRLQGTANGAP